jgi:GT2 family glycosyltransferase
MNKKVTAVIPTFNGLDLLKKHLSSVINDLRKGDELIIIEDAGTDDTGKWVNDLAKKTNKIDIKFIKNTKNLRFGMTVNKAVKLAKHDLIYLLNNDVAPKKNCLEILLTHVNEPNFFAVGPIEIDNDSNISGKNSLWFERGMFIHSKADDQNFGETAWVSGGSGLFDKQKWLKLKGFDKLFYPAYWEDIDLSFRASKKNWLVLFEPKAVVLHHHETTNTSVFGQKKMQKMSMRNGVKFAWKHGNLWQRIAFLIWRPYWWIKTLAS